MPGHDSRLLRQLATTLGLVALMAAGLAVAVLSRPSSASAEGTEATKKVVLQNERVRAQSNYYPAGASIPEQIEQLARLRDGGSISEAEFAAKKAELLDRM